MNTKDIINRILSLGTRRRNEQVRMKGRVAFILENKEARTRRVIEANNIVTDAGDKHYAQRAAGESPTDVFQTGRLVLGTTGNAPAKGSVYSDITAVVSGSLKAFDATYPKTADGDADNTGAGVDIITYRVSYTTAEANSAGITRLAITIASPVGGSPLLMYATVTSFTKTASDTLKVFVNHTFNGI